VQSKRSPRGTEQAVACPDPRLSHLSTGDKYWTYRTAPGGYSILMAELGWGPGAFYSLGSSTEPPAANSVCFFLRVGGWCGVELC